VKLVIMNILKVEDSIFYPTILVEYGFI